MYQPLSDRCLRVMTVASETGVPSLDVVRKLPTIEMSLAGIYAKEKSRDTALKILREAVVAPPRGFIGFERQLPEIITGACDAWRLWRVDFYVARLKLYYVDQNVYDDRYYCTSGISPGTAGHFRSCAYAYLVSPSSIGLNFDLAELGWRISYDMNCSSPSGSHSARLVEAYDGVSAGEFSYSVPSLAPFVP